jgi:hypothetical protein
MVDDATAGLDTYKIKQTYTTREELFHYMVQRWLCVPDIKSYYSSPYLYINYTPNQLEECGPNTIDLVSSKSTSYYYARLLTIKLATRKLYNLEYITYYGCGYRNAIFGASEK